jgi:hypothetical protein
MSVKGQNTVDSRLLLRAHLHENTTPNYSIVNAKPVAATGTIETVVEPSGLELGAFKDHRWHFNLASSVNALNERRSFAIIV